MERLGGCLEMDEKWITGVAPLRNVNVAHRDKKCNCEYRDKTWHEDSGFLTEKAFLPVSELRFGDTGKDGSEGYHTLGKLKCYGISTSHHQ